MIKTPLFEHHVKRGAKMVPFAGYEMPVWYSSIKEEHLSVRNHVGLFDISHMGLLHVRGKEAFSFLQYLSCNDLTKTYSSQWTSDLPGTMVYSMFLNEKGTILDDVMIGGIGSGSFIVIVNATNKPKILNWMVARKPQEVFIEDWNTSYGFLAIQGPQAVKILETLFDIPFSKKARFSVSICRVLGSESWILRTGYTGEDGFEWIIPNEAVSPIWDKLIQSGVTPCGLGSRDTLRLEAGLPLYGQELSEDITPWMTRYAWVVKMDHEFIGKEALMHAKNPKWATVGFIMKNHAIPRSRYPIQEGGSVTSGTLSPYLGIPIGMALIPVSLQKEGTPLHIMVRGIAHSGEIVSLPFIKRKT